MGKSVQEVKRTSILGNIADNQPVTRKAQKLTNGRNSCHLEIMATWIPMTQP